jgi:hypothetical protein
MRHLTAILVIILLVVFPSCKYFKGKKLFGRKADTMATWQVKQESIRVADSLKKIQERLKAVEDARLASIQRAEDERKAWELKYKYNIIVGSFITPEYAKDYAEEYRSRGYNPRIIKMKDSRFELVSAEAHESFRKAVARLAEFQDTVEVDAWMYIIK